MSFENSQYPLQDKILAAVDGAGTGFYLTGGTALSRCYFQHRYSDDLDFFINRSQKFHAMVDAVLSDLSGFSYAKIIEGTDVVSLSVENRLKVDFVNDGGGRIGESIRHPLYSKVDNLENILANKICAIIGRDDPKDVADLWVIAQNKTIDWEAIFQGVGSKAEGIFPPLVCERLESFPIEWLDEVKWSQDKKPDAASFKKNIDSIIRSMLMVRP
ncbi:MAG: nucleotidyl transferase AbiEii/AbiGii toxin family protein [Spirochaetales bacterium]|nr:nucleotidyl transferase AbiEii/AbiGii toxin family protein [Spirochaetales bacterium]